LPRKVEHLLGARFFGKKVAKRTVRRGKISDFLAEKKLPSTIKDAWALMKKVYPNAPFIQIKVSGKKCKIGK